GKLYRQKMKIKTLISRQLKLTERYQRQYQSIVRRALIDNGFNSAAAKKQIKEDIAALAERMTKNSVKLGMEWLKHGSKDET
ncbi:MAG: hypothetical protein PHV11_06270, partial [Candidatus Bipolaricaulis sp.]|nr:hypothetical protein [Candidatus Bipolaricaulis sp.]